MEQNTQEELQQPAELEMAYSEALLKYVIVRTYSAGVFAGYLVSREGRECELVHARRIWKWAGAATLSQLAVDGTKLPGECRFPCPVPSVILTEVVEILHATVKAMESIQGVPIWEA